MSAELDAFIAKADEVEQKILALQKAKQDAGMSAAEEKIAKDKLDRLSVIADPALPNPPDLPPDPSQP